MLGPLLRSMLMILIGLQGQLLLAQDALVIVVNPKCSLSQISREATAGLFLGNLKRLPSGEEALPVEQADARARFYRKLVNKSVTDINTYWARLLFTGAAKPPVQTSGEGVLAFVAANPGAIGMMEKGKVDRRVKVVPFLNGEGEP